MLQSKKFRLLTAYLALWLLGTLVLNIFSPLALAQPSAKGSPQTGGMAGKTIVGGKGVTLTSRQIGLKKNAADKTARPRPTAPLHRLNPNPQAPAGSSVKSGAPAIQVQPKPSRSMQKNDLSGFPSSNFSFPGNTVTQDDIDSVRFQSVPPDTMGAVGPTQYVMAINGLLRVFTKATGQPEQPFGNSDPSLDTFFDSVMTPVGAEGINYTTFPRLRYDRLSSRWFIMVNDVPGGLATQPNRVLLAVSNGPTITANTLWSLFYFQPSASFPNYSSAFADNPTLGIDANALYIGVNLYNTGGSQTFSTSAAFVVKKSSVLGSGPLVQTGFAPLINPTEPNPPINPTVTGPFSPVGVDNLDGSTGDGYFIGVNYSAGGGSVNTLQLRKVTDSGSDTPTLSDNITFTVPDFKQPLQVPHKDGGSDAKSLLDPVDYSLSNAVIRNGSLWTSHSISVDSTGISTNTPDRDAVRWYEIPLPTTSTDNLLPRQSGNIFDTASTTPKFYWLPSLSVSGQGNTVLGFNSAGVNDYISADFTGRTAADTIGTMRNVVIYQPGVVAYTPDNNTGDATFGRRWGDYSFTSLDPEDDMTFWTIQEYPYNSDADNDGIMDGYGIQIARINALPPATPEPINQSVAPGQSNISLTVTGDSINDSGFFDPGSGFSKRLQVALDGGIVVNNISTVTPTSFTLNISTSFATTGFHSLTVTNPDGQAITIPDFINVSTYGCFQPVSNGDDTGDGSFRAAVSNLTENCNVIIIDPATVQKITLLTPLADNNIPAGTTITTDKLCSAGKVEIDGTGIMGDGLILHGSTIFGLNIHGFIGRQIWAEEGRNQLNCVTVNAGPTQP